MALFYSNLRQNDEFRIRFADRVQNHFFAGGALYVDPENSAWSPDFPEQNVPAARYDELARLIELPLVAELGRWGDTSRRQADKFRGEDRLITPDDWASFRDGLYENYFPRRSAIVLDQLRSVGLYPELAAPKWNQLGGVVPKSFGLELGSETGIVYYTTDGSDPRIIGGDVRDTAKQFVEPLRLSQDTLVRARTWNDGEWSALTEATFRIASEFPLRVTELNYNPHSANPVPGLTELDVDNDRFEFIEVMNVGDEQVNLSNVQFVQSDVRGDNQGVRFTFAAQSLVAGERLVVVRDREAFQSRYGDSVRVAVGSDGTEGRPGEYGGRLSNDGEQITLLDPSGQVIQQFRYRPSGRTAGRGSSLEAVNMSGDYSDRSNWRDSREFGGSPGTEGLGRRGSTVVINELLANTQPPNSGQVELRNNSARDVNITGWYLSDSSSNYFHSLLTDSIVVPSYGYHVLSESDLGLNLDGERGGELWLISADSSGKPLAFEDHVTYNASARGVSLGPWPNAGGPFLPLSETTLGGPNTDRRIGDVIISEVYYNPVDPDGEGGVRVKDFEFIEVHNTTDKVVDLTGWRLTGDVAFEFPVGTEVQPGQSPVIVGFDPTDAARSTTFQFTLGLNPNAILLGQLSDSSNSRDRSGVINDSSARIQLRRPGDVSLDDPDFTPMLLVDQLEYQSNVPWPTLVSDEGLSLHRVEPKGYGPFAISWVGAKPSPGTTRFFVRTAGDANDDGRFDESDITSVLQSGRYLNGEPAGWSEGDWNGDNVFDQLDLVTALQKGRHLAPALAAKRAMPQPQNSPQDKASLLDRALREVDF